VATDGRTLRSFAGLAGGEAVARALSFIAMLVVARRLGPAMYGVVGVASGIMLYLNQVVDAGVELSGVPAVARQRDNAGLSDLVASVLTARAVIAAALTIVVVVVGLFALPQPDGSVLALYAPGLVFVAAGTRWVFLGLQQSSRVAIARIAGESSTLLLVLIALREVGDVAIVPIATLLGGAVAAVVMLGGLPGLGIRARLSFDRHPGRAILARGPQLVGFTLLGLLLFNADLIYLRFVTGQSAAGYYAAAYTLIAFCANLSAVWAQSVLPALARSDSDAARDDVYARAMMLAFAVSLPVAVGGILTATPLITLVYGIDFVPAVRPLVWLLPAIPLGALREVTVAGLLSSEDGERHLIRTNAITVLINLGLIIPVIPKYGMLGAAIVTLVTEVVRLVLSARYARQSGFAFPSVSRFLKPALAGAGMAGGILALGDQSLTVLVPAGVLLYGAGLAATGSVRVQKWG
jgi:O-antigen/teichoic acid export membrane protein